jgi:DNA uptake protein ComE-like DNA-binding protein
MSRFVKGCGAAAAVLTLVLGSATLRAQVGKSQGVVDVNTTAEKDLATMPNMTAAIAKVLVAQRPFNSVLDLHKLLLSQGLTAEQAMAFYGKAFVHINLNTATAEEIMLVPGAGRRMAREFDEYRPWKTYARFDKEIGKYVGPEATAKLAQYTFIPMNPNSASDADLQTIPGATASTVAALKSGRPYASASAVEQALVKATNAKEGKRLSRYFAM